jgi:hypothetical protein
MGDKQEGNRLDHNAIDKDDKKIHSFDTGERLYEIHVKGHLDSQWSDWFEGMELKLMENGETVLSGRIMDQAALMGILNKLIRFNLTLLSINEIKEGSEKQ